ncbi:unnamed protein product [Didymodactylos carnosus]|uniref:Uncharacterized protein n=1 Tax=Didymodactylos carnosus TaxID=1234261 RepID=A0A8S2CZ85_9BILA|nr:unnamed protein product [Didymodactylos carnosus]CAF3584247.1 unnamed protein product [Didymodactylos carnosus]
MTSRRSYFRYKRRLGKSVIKGMEAHLFPTQMDQDCTSEMITDDENDLSQNEEFEDKNEHIVVLRTQPPSIEVTNDPDKYEATNNDNYDIVRRLKPTRKDISATTMIIKVRRSQNNRDIDQLRRFLNSLQVDDAPKSMQAVQENLRCQTDLNINCESYKICSKCGKTNPVNTNAC